MNKKPELIGWETNEQSLPTAHLGKVDVVTCSDMSPWGYGDDSWVKHLEDQSLDLSNPHKSPASVAAP